jgi:hypothetical protein
VPFWSVLEASWSVSEASPSVKERLRAAWRCLGASWSRLGVSWSVLEASWIVLEPSCKRFGPMPKTSRNTCLSLLVGASWSRPGAILETSSSSRGAVAAFDAGFDAAAVLSKRSWIDRKLLRSALGSTPSSVTSVSLLVFFRRWRRKTR